MKHKLAWLALAVGLTGCVKDPSPSHPMDPYESYNRQTFDFNLKVDRYILHPVAKSYQTMFPQFVRSGVHNFFMNLDEAPSMVNHCLQGDIRGVLVNLNRFVINTTFGIGGLFDVASRLGLKPASTSLDQTLGVWGVKPKYYVMLPFLGPSTDRGIAVDVAHQWFTCPDSWIQPTRYLLKDRAKTGLMTLDIIQRSEKNLGVIFYQACDYHGEQIC